MSNANEHLKVVTALLAAIYDMGYEGYWKSLRQNGNELEVTICYKPKPEPGPPPPEPEIKYG